MRSAEHQAIRDAIDKTIAMWEQVRPVLVEAGITSANAPALFDVPFASIDDLEPDNWRGPHMSSFSGRIFHILEIGGHYSNGVLIYCNDKPEASNV